MKTRLERLKLLIIRADPPDRVEYRHKWSYAVRPGCISVTRKTVRSLSLRLNILYCTRKSELSVLQKKNLGAFKV